MPPKGWRKNAEGKFPQNSKDSEFVSIDDILFPKSLIQKLAKSIAQTEDGNMIISKDSLTALQRSATVFVSHVMYHARLIAKAADRKTVNSSDILKALEKAGLMGFVPEVKTKLMAFENNLEIKKKQKAEAKASERDSEDGPASKKLKDNVENSVAITQNEAQEEIEHEDDDDDTEVNTMNEDEDEEAAEEDDDTQDHRSQNPIALLNKDEQELEGDHNDTETKVASDEEDHGDEE